MLKCDGVSPVLAPHRTVRMRRLFSGIPQDVLHNWIRALSSPNARTRFVVRIRYSVADFLLTDLGHKNAQVAPRHRQQPRTSESHTNDGCPYM